MLVVQSVLVVLVAYQSFFPNPPSAASEAAATAPGLPAIAVNDNRRAAGSLDAGTLTLGLRAAEGMWQPEGASGPSLRIQAFGEVNGPLMIPGPLGRVTEGVEVAMTVRNDLSDTMRVHGLCDRGAQTCDPVVVPPGEVRAIRFRSGPAGTYHYWATTTGMPLQFRPVGDTQLAGPFVVDPPAVARGEDRVFVITDWTSLTLEQLKRVASADDPGETFLGFDPKIAFLVNGLSWPHTERLAYRLAEPVHWKIVNLSTQAHTMHLHGFYFDVDALGDGTRGARFADGDRQRVVTQLMQPGETMSMTWTPERVGNWLFHCHIKDHVSPGRRLSQASSVEGHHAAHDASAGMAGMILGVTIVGENDPPAPVAAPARKMTLLMQSEPKRDGDDPAYGFVLATDAASAPTQPA